MFCCMDCDIKDIPEWCRGHVRMATTVCVMAIVDHVLDRGSSGCLVGGGVGGSGQEHTFNFSWRPHTPLSALAQHASYSRWTLSSVLKQFKHQRDEFGRYINYDKEEGVRAVVAGCKGTCA